MIKKWFHKVLMPRGKNFVYDEKLEKHWDQVEIHQNNKTLSTIYKMVDPQRPTIIFCHPYVAESRQFFLKRGHAQMYLDLGYNLVIFDFNGFGHSPFVNFNYQEDITLVVNYFKGVLKFSTFICHGISFGASQIITYTSQTPHGVDRIIIENCLDSNLSYYKKRNKNLYYMMRSLMILPGVNRNHNYIQAAAKIHNVQKALLIYNLEDDLTTIAMGEKIYKALRIPAEMRIFQGKHLEAFSKNNDQYTKIIASFLDFSTK